MIVLALLLGSLGIADLVRLRVGGAAWIAAAAGFVLFVLGAIGSGLDWWWAPLAVLAICGWLFATRENAGPRRAGYWAIGGLVVVVVAAFVAGPALGEPSGLIVDWYATLPYAALRTVSFGTFALTVGGALFLFETSNVIVRLALRGERSVEPVADLVPVPAPAPVAVRRSWRTRREPVVTGPAQFTEPVQFTEPAQFTELKGGRFIGPLERIFLLALVLAGQFTAIAALVAAKGIIRFPEISKDAPGGSKAEYFLVGSFASWALVLVVALLVTFGST